MLSGAKRNRNISDFRGRLGFLASLGMTLGICEIFNAQALILLGSIAGEGWLDVVPIRFVMFEEVGLSTKHIAIENLVASFDLGPRRPVKAWREDLTSELQGLIECIAQLRNLAIRYWSVSANEFDV